MNPTADGSVVVPAEFWELPITGEPVLLYTYSQIGFPYRTLSSSGNSIAYTKLNDDNSYSICLYQYLTKQDDCTSMAGEQIYTRNWSPDDEKYNFDIFNTILGDDSIHYESTYYIGSIFEPASLANEIDAYVWLAWHRQGTRPGHHPIRNPAAPPAHDGPDRHTRRPAVR